MDEELRVHHLPSLPNFSVKDQYFRIDPTPEQISKRLCGFDCDGARAPCAPMKRARRAPPPPRAGHAGGVCIRACLARFAAERCTAF